MNYDMGYTIHAVWVIILQIFPFILRKYKLKKKENIDEKYE